MAEFVADGRGIVIRELDGERREFLFEDEDRPEEGVETPIEARVVTSRPPGAKAPVRQVLGTEEGDIELRFRFRDVWSYLAGHARQRVKDLRSLCLAQSLCQLEWGQALVLRGRVKRVVPRWLREGEVDCTVTFEVDEADEAEIVQQSVAPVSDVDVAAIFQFIAQLAEQASDTAASLSTIPAVK